MYFRYKPDLMAFSLEEEAFFVCGYLMFGDGCDMNAYWRQFLSLSGITRTA